MTRFAKKLFPWGKKFQFTILRPPEGLTFVSKELQYRLDSDL